LANCRPKGPLDYLLGKGRKSGRKGEREKKVRKWAKMVDNGEKWSKVVPRT
jgi:hypothetical protein